MQFPSFESKEEVKDWVFKYKRDVSKPFRVVRSQERYYEVVCLNTTCNFHLKTARIKGKFVVKNFNDHSCSEFIANVTTSTIFSEVKPFVFDMNNSVKPKDCIRRLRNYLGISTKYQNAYRAIRRQKAKSSEESFKLCKLINSWLEWMVQNNIGFI